MRRLSLTILTSCSLLACSGDLGDDSTASATGGGGATVTSASGEASSGVGGAGNSSSSAEASGSSTAASGSGSVASSTSSGGAMTTCDLWKTVRADMSEGTWSGSLAGCNAGDVSEDGRDHALAMVNLYRGLAGLGAVGLDAGYNDAAQSCALMMHANNALNHFPPSSWKCFSDLGAGAAGKSNIATTPGVQAVDLYMIDPGAGNASTIGHRRWILSNSLGPIGLGSTSEFSCMWVIGGVGNAAKEFTPWPPAGEVPIQAWNVTFESLDSTGWTIQSDTISFAGAKVTVNDGGQDMPVTTAELLPNYGSAHAVRFTPKGWKAQAGHTYAISVQGSSKPVSYSVSVVDCK